MLKTLARFAVIKLRKVNWDETLGNLIYKKIKRILDWWISNWVYPENFKEWNQKRTIKMISFFKEDRKYYDQC